MTRRYVFGHLLALSILGPTRPARADETAAASALASQPEVPALRGGTLGLPAGATSGASALFAGQYRFSDSQFSSAFIARLGRLQITPGFYVEALGETANFDIPTAGLSPGSNPPIRPLPEIKTTSVASVGARFVFGHSASVEQRKHISRCIGERNQPGLQPQEGTPYDAAEQKACNDLGIDMSAANGLTNAANDTAAIALALHRVMLGPSISLGLRGLFSTSPTANSVGAPTGGGAVELTPQYLWSTGGFFASASAVYLAGTKSTTDASAIKTENVLETRATVGGNIQGSADANSSLLPTLGAYATLSRNWWTNPYAAPGTDASIRGTQFEAAIYASGHFTSGFSGLLSLGVLRPFGYDSPPMFTVSFAPSIGAPLPQGTP